MQNKKKKKGLYVGIFPDAHKHIYKSLTSRNLNDHLKRNVKDLIILKSCVKDNKIALTEY